MTFKSGEYTIEPVVKMKNLERAKIPSEVKLIQNNTWVCTSKVKLIEFAEQHRELKIKKLQDRLFILQSGGIVCNG